MTLLTPAIASSLMGWVTLAKRDIESIPTPKPWFGLPARRCPLKAGDHNYQRTLQRRCDAALGVVIALRRTFRAPVDR
jgi:hypothetical protein